MTTTLPFKILDISGQGYHLVITIKINGKAAKLIIDTGASKTVFDKTRIEKFVKQRTFEKHESLSSGLGTNTMQSEMVTIKKVKIADLEIQNYKSILLDLSHVNDSYQQVGLKPIDGVLGSDILLDYNAVIDYEKRTLRFKYKKMARRSAKAVTD